MTSTSAPSQLRTPSLDPVSRLAGWAVLAAALVVTAFFLLVRGEPRPGLAASGAVVAVVGVAILTRVRFAAVLSVALGLFMVLFPALRKYYAFSLERPDEILGFGFTVVAVGVAAVLLVAGAVATIAAVAPRSIPRGRGPLLGTVVLSVIVAAVGLAGFSALSQPDQRGELSSADVAALPEVVMDDFRYTPDRLRAVSGKELVLRLRNDDVESYRFTIDELDIDVIVPSGREAVVRVTPNEPGALTFYSSEEGGEHRDLGMIGTIEVAG